MKDKRHKDIEDVIEDYLRLTDEQIEIPLMIDKANKKYRALVEANHKTILKKDDLDDAHKIYIQIKKCEERKGEVAGELREVEDHLKHFLGFLNGKQIAYEKKDDTEKQKLTYIFWMEG